MNLKPILFIIVLLIVNSAFSKDYQLPSPDQKIKITISITDIL